MERQDKPALDATRSKDRELGPILSKHPLPMPEAHDANADKAKAPCFFGTHDGVSKYITLRTPLTHHMRLE
jgi:hypothetical protein